MHMLGTHITWNGLKEHAFIKIAPNMLWRVNKIFDTASNAIGPSSGLGIELGLGMGMGMGLGLGEGTDAAMHGSDVGRDGGAGGLHVHDRVGGVD